MNSFSKISLSKKNNICTGEYQFLYRRNREINLALDPPRQHVVLKRELQFTKLKNNKTFKILPRIQISIDFNGNFSESIDILFSGI